MSFTRCPNGARCNKCNIPETSRGNLSESEVLGEWGKRERRRGKEKQARSHKNDIEKKIAFISHVHKKRKEKSQTELK